MQYPLSRIPEGGWATVRSVAASGSMHRRLLDLGFTPGAQLKCLFSAPGGDPRAYGVHGTIIALRNADAEAISLEESPV